MVEDEEAQIGDVRADFLGQRAILGRHAPDEDRPELPVIGQRIVELMALLVPVVPDGLETGSRPQEDRGLKLPRIRRLLMCP